MELVLNVLLAASTLACLGTVSFVTVSSFRAARNLKTVSANIKKEAEEKAMMIVQAFVPAGVNDNSGCLFAELADIGYFPSPRMGNSGEKSSYDRQLKDFWKYNTPEISAAMKRVGKNNEQYNI